MVRSAMRTKLDLYFGNIGDRAKEQFRPIVPGASADRTLPEVAIRGALGSTMGLERIE